MSKSDYSITMEQIEEAIDKYENNTGIKAKYIMMNNNTYERLKAMCADVIAYNCEQTYSAIFDLMIVVDNNLYDNFMVLSENWKR